MSELDRFKMTCFPEGSERVYSVGEPGQLSEKDWRTYFDFLDAVLFEGDEELSSPKTLPLRLSPLWSVNKSSVLGLALDEQARLVGTTGNTVISGFGVASLATKEIFRDLGDPFILHHSVAVHPERRGEGLFSGTLYPGMARFCGHALYHFKQDIHAVLNLKPGDEGELWRKKGFVDLPEDTQACMFHPELKHLYKKYTY